MLGLPRVDIQYQNGGLGLVARPDDRVVGLVLNCVGYNNLPLYQPQQFFSLKDFDDLVTAVTGLGFYVEEARRQISDFYRVSGTGSELWVLFIDPVLTTTQLFTGGAMSIMLDIADGRLNVVGVSRYVEAEPTTNPLLDGLDKDVIDALDEAQALAVDYASQHKPVRFLLDGKRFDGNVATVRNLKQHTFNRVGVCVGSTGGAYAALGLLLGRIASVAVNTNIGRVKDGSVSTSAAYLTNGQTVSAFGLKASALHDKGYIFLRKFPNKAGFYWNDDHMATGDLDDYYSLSNGRVIDKAARITYATFIEELLDTVLVDEKGKILKTTLKQYQAKIERAIGLTMAANQEISNVEAFIDPNQDILATSKMVVDLRITPTGTNRIILVKLGLFNPNAAA